MSKTHLNKVAPWSEVVARCKKCGREFAYVNPETTLIDNYVPMGTPPRLIMTTEPCGGEIEMLADKR